MKRIFQYLLCSVALTCIATGMRADDTPTISPTATYTNTDGETEESTSYSGSAPITGVFEANAENTAGWNCSYEWRFTLSGESTPYLVRYEEDTQYTFTAAGTHNIQLYAVFTQGNDTVKYTEDYWADAETLTVTISESALTFPNAFSPNGDGINDTYKPKTCQSIVEFKAVILNRWGQKLYEWTDPTADGWDGTYHGKDVKQGVYFVLVEAKGADGRKYNIKRDVNLLRGYTEGSTYSTE